MEVNHGLQNLVQSDADLSEILMRAFIFRRVELIARGLGRCSASRVRQFRWDILRIREFLSRNGFPARMSISTTIRAFRKYWTGSKSRRQRFPMVICRGKLFFAIRRTGK